MFGIRRWNEGEILTGATRIVGSSNEDDLGSLAMLSQAVDLPAEPNESQSSLHLVTRNDIKEKAEGCFFDGQDKAVVEIYESV